MASAMDMDEDRKTIVRQEVMRNPDMRKTFISYLSMDDRAQNPLLTSQKWSRDVSGEKYDDESGLMQTVGAQTHSQEEYREYRRLQKLRIWSGGFLTDAYEDGMKAERMHFFAGAPAQRKLTRRVVTKWMDVHMQDFYARAIFAETLCAHLSPSFPALEDHYTDLFLEGEESSAVVAKERGISIDKLLLETGFKKLPGPRSWIPRGQFVRPATEKDGQVLAMRYFSRRGAASDKREKLHIYQFTKGQLQYDSWTDSVVPPRDLNLSEKPLDIGWQDIPSFLKAYGIPEDTKLDPYAWYYEFVTKERQGFLFLGNYLVAQYKIPDSRQMGLWHPIHIFPSP